MTNIRSYFSPVKINSRKQAVLNLRETPRNLVFNNYSVQPLFRVSKGEMSKIQKTLEKLTNSQLTLSNPIQIGAGGQGIVVTCAGTDFCNPDWKTAVMKIQSIRNKANEDSYNWEVKYMKKLNKYHKNHPRNIPLSPKLIASFKAGQKGIIVMEHVNTVARKIVKNPKNIVSGWPKQLEKMNKANREAAQPAVNNAIRRLRATGINHGNLHRENIFIIKLENGTYKAFFIDFGSSFNV